MRFLRSVIIFIGLLLISKLPASAEVVDLELNCEGEISYPKLKVKHKASRKVIITRNMFEGRRIQVKDSFFQFKKMKPNNQTFDYWFYINRISGQFILVDQSHNNKYQNYMFEGVCEKSRKF